ncbi:MAG: hypothetical protein IKP50_05240 [Bacilli bacterium]|nr:hypothetical protein [Bacilli bacterium]
MPKFRNYNQVLKSRGYKVFEPSYSKYGGEIMFVKEHKYNRITCFVEKDTHGKGQRISFTILSQLVLLRDDPEKAKECKNDYEYLLIEANKIYEAFEELKVLKSPKYIYKF